ncbi:aspartic proteinase nepenthesin-1-like [Pyrus x bretschneideri]|uniref:aspartic proteinase nepenthesin-1-like n=1 Tax=Pyrus x bretschneideri TaxID=225117 RepID=UPI002030A16C|nr:aspartic proteinase nepenthesin-1-like [Pyrus x bretschneideri]
MTALALVYKLSTSLFLLLSLLWGAAIAVSAKPNGFSVELMHIFSPASPLYPGNISFQEEMQRLLQRSDARMRHIDATIASALTLSNNMSQTAKNRPYDEFIRPQVEYYPIATYIVAVGLGTFPDAKFPERPFKSYYLYMDTGSALTWVLCADCEKQKPPRCFKTREPPFPNGESQSYKPLPCNKHRFCTPNLCIGDHCSEAAEETFTFLSNKGRPLPIEDIVFGCAHDVRNVDFGSQEDFKIAGFMGLGYSPYSFPLQISHRIQGKFSYCLSHNREIQTYLRFGGDIVEPFSGLRVTNLVLIPDIPYYYVNLKAISVNGQKLLIDPSVFALRSGGYQGGCLMDNGSSVTYLITPAFKALVKFLEMFYMRYPNYVRHLGPISPAFELCYRWAPPMVPLPAVTFHFEGADLELKDEAFVTLEDRDGSSILCLAMVENTVRTILGSLQQANYRFIYDLNNALLKFIPEDCAKWS